VWAFSQEGCPPVYCGRSFGLTFSVVAIYHRTRELVLGPSWQAYATSRRTIGHQSIAPLACDGIAHGVRGLTLRLAVTKLSMTECFTMRSSSLE